MQSKNKFFSILALAIAVVAFSTFTFAQDTKTDAEKAEKKAARVERGEKGGLRDHRMGRRGFAGRRGKMAAGMMMRGIDLTDAQKDQIKALHASNKPDQAVRDEVRSLMKAKKDATITADQTARLKAIHEDGIAKRKAMHEQLQNILTAEQKAQIETRKAEMKTRMQERKQKLEQRRKAKPADATKPTI